MLRIATPGVPLSAPKGSGTIEGIEYAATLGINAMEMEWVQSTPKNPDHVAKVAETAKQCGFALTVHGSYFINLCADDPEKLEASKRRIIDACAMAQIAGAVSVCIHPAFYQGKTSAQALESVRRATDDILKSKNTLFPDVNLAYETMGKQTQFGTLEEVLTVSKEFGLYPCVDISHMHARANGGMNAEKEWKQMLDTYAEYLGEDALQHVHFHLSGILYSEKGEKKHLPMDEAEFKWREYVSVLKKRKVGGILVCESPLMEKDTLLIQEYYRGL
ncbi:TIM barrel protein [Candidatus Peribacteria bacterium]|nr:MAG: TIM barrel protein [Candidatus Peribacteria bacterium]